MVDIQIKHHNGTSWESLFPKTKARITELNDGTTVETAITQLVSNLATKVTLAEVDAEIEKIIGSAPDALDTLQELAEALGQDPNFATTVTNQIASKVDKVSGKGLSTNDFTNALLTKLNALPASVYTKAEVDGIAGGKVDKVTGKGLSTNDFTTALQSKLTALPTDVYTKTEVNTSLNGKVDKVTGKVLSSNDFTNTLLSKLNTLPANAYSKTEVDGKLDTLAGTVIPVQSTTPTNASIWFETL